jgi:hypothetical protein
MAWWLWMIAGAASAVLAFILFVAFMNWLDDRATERNRLRNIERSNAETSMQKVVENTVAKMFEAMRNHYR